MSDLHDSVSEQPLSAFRPQQVNANKHRPRGEGMLEKSLHEVGWMGAITVAKDNQVFDGSLRLEKTAHTFDGVNPIVIDSDGKRPVIVRRTDIESADSDLARKASVLANRVAEVSLDWDTDVLEQWNDEGSIEVDSMWFPDEIEKWGIDGEAPDDSEWGDAFGGLPEGDRAPFQQMTFTLHDDQVEQVKAALEFSKKIGPFDSENENSNGNALARICELFSTDYGNS